MKNQVRSTLSPLKAGLYVVGITLGAVFASGSSEACDSCNEGLKAKIKANQNLTLAEQEILKSIQNAEKDAKLAANTQTGQVITTDQVMSSVSAPGAAIPKAEVFEDILKRDKKLPIPATSWVAQDTPADKEFVVELAEGETYIGNGVMYKGFTVNGKIPGTTFFAEEGDVVKFTVVNKGTIPHGASIHAAYTQTSKYVGKVMPGTTQSVVFKANTPGVFMYHCAPGGHAIPIHILNGQYGMIVIKPKKKYKLEEMLGRGPDVDLYIVQHEFYGSGKDAIDGKPMYTAFNGKTFRYVEEPIKAKPGDYVRIQYLNVGPNLASTFHIVGIIWDFAYWQGHPDVAFPGGQSVISGPTDSWVIEFRVPPEEGNYLLLSHAVGSTDRGAIGILVADKNAKTPVKVLAEGPDYSAEQMKEFKEKAIRTISPSGLGSEDVDSWVEVPPGKDAVIKIIGNSFYPKRLKISKGTKVKWVNEDVFSYLAGEFSGIHNVIVTKGPESFASPMLTHAQSWEKRFTKSGKYEYLCAPHPYMQAEVMVK